jgi:hypothetical protein
MVTVHLGVVVVGVGYDTLELHSRFEVDFNTIYGMHQPSKNLKT